MKKHWSITQESLDRLLDWLGPDHEMAGSKYEEIRRRIIKFFVCRSCHEAEDLADETINRVVKRVQDIAATYEGDPALYFFGAAQKVHLEYLRKRATPPPALPPPVDTPDENAPEYLCLEQCLRQLPDNDRELILKYYQGDKKLKIKLRQELSQQLDIAINALRIRACRIRAVLQRCVLSCMEKEAT